MDEIEKEVTSVLLKYICPDDWSDEKKNQIQLMQKILLKPSRMGKQLRSSMR